MTERDEYYVNIWEHLLTDRKLHNLPFYEQMNEVRQLFKAGELTHTERSALVHFAVQGAVECKLTIDTLNPR